MIPQALNAITEEDLQALITMASMQLDDHRELCQKRLFSLHMRRG